MPTPIDIDTDMNSEASVHNRAVNTAQQERIDSMIADEPDNRSRLTLMIMSSINKSIAANTDLTFAVHREVKALKGELENHIQEGEAIKNKGAGAYMVMRLVVPALWIIMGSAVGSLYSSYSAFQTSVAEDLVKIHAKLVDIDTRIIYHGITEIPKPPTSRR